MKKLGALVRVKRVVPLEKFQVRLGFDDGTVKVIDLEPFLWGPVFETIRNDPKVFRSVKVEGGTIVWENGADIDPDVLYYDLKPAWMEKHEAVR
ncbi:MAG: DUF2442 domain-containing protein [Chloroflexi bacterium]|nr:DUF2442 domain-containing protein [Chloroflexota bacterium]